MSKVGEYFYNLAMSAVLWLCLFKVLDRMAYLMGEWFDEQRKA